MRASVLVTDERPLPDELAIDQTQDRVPTRVFIPPHSDRLFKRLFGDERDVQVLVGLLRAVLDLPAEDLAEVVLDPTHTSVESARDKEVVLDVKVRTATGRRVDVEIQLASVPNLGERVLSTLLGCWPDRSGTASGTSCSVRRSWS